jgi:uncharacterized protein YyaL (SSP411 family)
VAARLARYFGEPTWERVARGIVVAIQDRVRQAPTGFGSTLQAAELLLAPHREIAIVGPPEARAPFERALAARFLPAVTVAPAAGAGGIPLLKDRGVPVGSPSGAAAFLCRDFVCELPATSVEDFAAQLDQLAVSH